MASGSPKLWSAPPLGPRPLVSICIPTFNRGELIADALSSALAQTYEPVEVIVVDDASTDDTARRVRAFRDPRIRLEVNPKRLGQAGNRNRSIALARGDLVKFLDSDDALDPHSVASLASLFEEEPALGLAFSRRTVLLEQPEDQASQVWLDGHRELHQRFTSLRRINDGRQLFAEWLAAGLQENWIGEPSTVMVRRAHLYRHGGFNPFVHQTVDSDLWLRLLPHTMIGFIDEPLAMYRYGKESEHTLNSKTQRAWVDRLWTLESLAGDPDTRGAFPQVTTLLSQERRQAWRTAARMGYVPQGDKVPVRPYLQYVSTRFRHARAVA